ncbi:MAG: hypothetical protein KDB27_27925 [Planctomycetales bacterium]|nr:hypothetical protein [Planctomycetales bacterium]
MRIRNATILLLASGLLVGSASPLTAENPLKRFTRRKTNKAESLQLTEQNGPWMIYAASFAGPGAKEEATKLVKELRSSFGLQAYLHSKDYDFTDDVVGLNRNFTPRKMQYNLKGSFTEYAVLVGNYNSVDDEQLQETLQELKYCQPKSLAEDEKTTLRFAGLRAMHKKWNADKSKRTKGPLGRAFAVPNPMVAREAYAPKGVDSFVYRINKDVKYSLLKCPGKYSVRVATFRGKVVTNQLKVKQLQNGGKLQSKLEEAAVKANKVTMALRKIGYEAYEFHDRHESYVTVGSFDWVEKTDGRQDVNPEVLKLVQKFSPSNGNTPANRSVQAQAKKVAGISLDLQPTPVPVPKRSLASDYAKPRWLR